MSKTIPIEDLLAKVPEFLAREKVASGGYMRTSKAVLRGFNRPNQDLCVRVVAIIILHSHGYESNVAVVLKRGKRSFLRHAHIMRELDAGNVAAFKESKVPLSDEQRREMLPSRQSLRRALVIIEEEYGQIVRARDNVGFDRLDLKGSLDEAVTSKAITLFADLKGADSKRAHGNVCFFLLPVARPARRLSVKFRDYSNGDKQQKTNEKEKANCANLLFLEWGAEFGVEPDIFRRNPEMQPLMREVVRLDQARQRDEDRLKKDRLAYQRQLLQAKSKAELIAREAGSPTITGIQAPLFSATPQQVPSAAGHPDRSRDDRDSPALGERATPDRGVKGSLPISAAPNSNGTPSRDETRCATGEGRKGNAAGPAERISAAVNSNGNGVECSRGGSSSARQKAVTSTAAEFNEELCCRFTAIGAGIPTKKQTDAILASLNGLAPQFLDWLTASEMQRRRPRHGGVLPLLVEEFGKVHAHRERAFTSGPRAPQSSPAQQREDLEWLAENDPDPVMREDARRRLGSGTARSAAVGD